MKKMIAILTASTLSFSAMAQSQTCTPEDLAKTTENYSLTLLCASLEKGFSDCLNYLWYGSTTGMAAQGLLWSPKGLNQVDVPKMTGKLNIKLSGEAIKLLEEMKAAGGFKREEVAVKLIKELQKHPRLYHNQIQNLVAALRNTRIVNAFMYANILGVIASSIPHLFLTSPEDCEKLTHEGLLKADNEWIAFGYNCGRVIKPKFFTLPVETQSALIARSPALCLALHASPDLKALQKAMEADSRTALPTNGTVR